MAKSIKHILDKIDETYQDILDILSEVKLELEEYLDIQQDISQNLDQYDIDTNEDIEQYHSHLCFYFKANALAFDTANEYIKTQLLIIEHEPYNKERFEKIKNSVTTRMNEYRLIYDEIVKPIIKDDSYYDIINSIEMLPKNTPLYTELYQKAQALFEKMF